MNTLWDKANKPSSYIKEKTETIASKIGTLLAVVLVFAPSLQVNSKVQEPTWYYQGKGAPSSKTVWIETAEKSTWYYQGKGAPSSKTVWIETAEDPPEAIIKNAVAKSLLWVKSIYYFPREIKYDGLTKLQAEKKWYPTLLDVNPKKITEPIKSIVITVGNRRFRIDPIAGKISWIEMGPEGFVIITTFKDVTYDIKEKLPNLVYKIRATPKWKWVKEWFKNVTVTEI